MKLFRIINAYRNVAGLIVFLCCWCLTTRDVVAEVLRSVSVNGQIWYIDVQKNDLGAEVWFRRNNNSCSPQDLRVMSIKVDRATLTQAGRLTCRAKSVYDGGLTIAGCGATVGTGLCVAASFPIAGTVGVLCSGVIIYPASGGFATSLDRLSNIIATKLAGDRNWASIGISANVSTGQWLAAIDRSIDLACLDAK